MGRCRRYIAAIFHAIRPGFFLFWYTLLCDRSSVLSFFTVCNTPTHSYTKQRIELLFWKKRKKLINTLLWQPNEGATKWNTNAENVQSTIYWLSWWNCNWKTIVPPLSSTIASHFENRWHLTISLFYFPWAE